MVEDGYALPDLFDMEWLTATAGTTSRPRTPHVQTFADNRSRDVDVAGEHQCAFWTTFPHT
ncbi:hypothetical protein [Actinoplanes sp. HUAS TT8]|uniref:hypothetical protein n=1 Tax=Actinoplanes sp. HUAS TT8 TaxID=3447453 RepID=UPI003F51CA9D